MAKRYKPIDSVDWNTLRHFVVETAVMACKSDDLSELWCRKWLAGIGEDANYEYSISRPNATPEAPKIRKRDRDRAEAVRLAGGPKPSLRDRAVAVAVERGTVRTRDLTEIGVPRCYLARMCEEGLLEKLAYGI